MYVVKVQYEDVTRRLVIQEPYSYDGLLKTVAARFELSAVDAAGAQLRYTDPDGDVISMNTDQELLEALALVNQSETPPLLRMKLIVNNSQGTSQEFVDTCASPCSEDSSIVVVSAERIESKDELSAQVHAKFEEERLQLERAALEEAEKARALEEAEKARALEEEKALQALEAERLLEEEKARAAKIAAEEAEKFRLEQEREKRERCEIALLAEKENTIARISSLIRMGCSRDDLWMFSERILKMFDETDGAVIADCVEVEVEAVAHDASLDAAAKDDDAIPPAVPEPLVDWALQQALKEQERNGEVFPSPEQRVAVIEAGNRAEDLASRLTEFYLVHNHSNVSKVPDLVSQFKGKEAELNLALSKRYGCDLTTFREVAPATVIDLCAGDDRAAAAAAAQEEPAAARAIEPVAKAAPAAAADVAVVPPAEAVAAAAAAAPAPPADAKLDEAVAKIMDMGLDCGLDRIVAAVLKHNYDVGAAVNELFN